MITTRYRPPCQKVGSVYDPSHIHSHRPAVGAQGVQRPTLVLTLQSHCELHAEGSSGSFGQQTRSGMLILVNVTGKVNTRCRLNVRVGRRCDYDTD